MILVGGEALFDLVVAADGSLSAHPGGGPFNAARTLGRLEQPVAYLGRLSTDRFGRTLRRMLAGDGVRLDAVVDTDEPTTLALAELDAHGSARWSFYVDGTSVPGLVELPALPPATVLHVGTLGLVLEPIATTLAGLVDDFDGFVFVDPNCRPSIIRDEAAYRARIERVLGRADVVKVSDEDLAYLSPRAEPIAAARALGPAVALVTRGADGAVVVTPDDEIAVPAPPARVADTIGAGDAFGAGFLAWWHGRGLTAAELSDTGKVVDATRFAVLVAAKTCERAGASPPRLDEL